MLDYNNFIWKGILKRDQRDIRSHEKVDGQPRFLYIWLTQIYEFIMMSGVEECEIHIIDEDSYYSSMIEIG